MHSNVKRVWSCILHWKKTDFWTYLEWDLLPFYFMATGLSPSKNQSCPNVEHQSGAIEADTHFETKHVPAVRKLLADTLFDHFVEKYL